MEVDTVSGALSPEVQIKCAIEEGMENIFRAIFGENLRTSTEYKLSSAIVSGVQLAQVCIVSASQKKINAVVPVRHPDDACGGYRIDEVPFQVEANDWAKGIHFEAWCENNPSLGAKVIVRQTQHKTVGRKYRWLVADSMESEVLYRGPWPNLFSWAKEVALKHWHDDWLHSS